MTLERLTDGGWVRRVTYASGYTDAVHLAGRDDETPEYNGPPDRTRCGFCYAGPAHSERRHERNVGGAK